MKPLIMLLSVMFALQVNAEELDKQCVPEGKWVSSQGKTLSNSELIKSFSEKKVVLIGEDHENPEHHRMQLHTIAQVYARQPDLVLGFEAFPRKTQKYLDQWVEGKLNEKEFFDLVKWDEIWRFNKDFYAPMFHFARMNKIPMIALNVDRKLVSEVGNKGWDNIDEKDREGVSKPADPSEEYLQILADVFSQHMPKHGHSEGDEAGQMSGEDLQEILDNPSFQKFAQGQLVWDRAMAEAIAKVLKVNSNATVIGVMGAGHVMGDYGAIHQLVDLGVAAKQSVTLMPWDGSIDCSELKAGAFDYGFGVNYVEAKEVVEQQYPRLGVYLEHNNGVVITRIVPNSIADSMGLKIDDKIIQIAGKPVEQVMDVVETVKSTLFGTWLPLKILRDDKEMEFVAKFPPQS